MASTECSLVLFFAYFPFLAFLAPKVIIMEQPAAEEGWQCQRCGWLWHGLNPPSRHANCTEGGSRDTVTKAFVLVSPKAREMTRITHTHLKLAPSNCDMLNNNNNNNNLKEIHSSLFQPVQEVLQKASAVPADDEKRAAAKSESQWDSSGIFRNVGYGWLADSEETRMLFLRCASFQDFASNCLVDVEREVGVGAMFTFWWAQLQEKIIQNSTLQDRFYSHGEGIYGKIWNFPDAAETLVKLKQICLEFMLMAKYLKITHGRMDEDSRSDFESQVNDFFSTDVFDGLFWEMLSDAGWKVFHDNSFLVGFFLVKCCEKGSAAARSLQSATPVTLRTLALSIMWLLKTAWIYSRVTGRSPATALSKETSENYVTFKNILKICDGFAKNSANKIIGKVVPLAEWGCVMLDGYRVEPNFLSQLYSRCREKCETILADLMGVANFAEARKLVDFDNLIFSDNFDNSTVLFDAAAADDHFYLHQCQKGSVESMLFFEFDILQKNDKRGSDSSVLSRRQQTVAHVSGWEKKILENLADQISVTKKLHTWLKKADELLAHFLVLLQIGSGGPARGTELHRASLCNSVSRGRRTVFFLAIDKVLTVLPVPKTDKKLGGAKHPIPRLLEAKGSQSLVLYTISLRRLHCLLKIKDSNDRKKRDFSLNGTIASFQTHLWVDWKVDTLRRQFHQVTGKLMKFGGLKMSYYRHYAQYVVTAFVLPAALDRLDLLQHGFGRQQLLENWGKDRSIVQLALLPVQEQLMKQAGHSVTTANLQYGEAGISSLPQIPTMVLEQYMCASQVFHRILEDSFYVEEKFKRMTIGGGGMRQCRQLPLKYSVQIEKSGEMLNIGLQCKGGHDHDPQCWEKLLKLFSNEKYGRFKSETQERAVKSHIEGDDKDFIVVMPTGGGKTLVILLPLLYEIMHHSAVSGLTILVTPFVALREAQLRLFAEQLNCFAQPFAMHWKDFRENLYLQKNYLVTPYTQELKTCVVLVTPESALEERFLGFYYTLKNFKRIRRVVFDEGHNIVEAGSTYRPTYEQTFKKLKFGEALNLGGGGGGEGAKTTTMSAGDRTTVPVTICSATFPIDGDVKFRKKFREDILYLKEERKRKMGKVANVGHFEIISMDVVCRKELSIGYTVVKENKKAFEALLKTAHYFVKLIEHCHIIVYVTTFQDQDDLAAFFLNKKDVCFVVKTFRADLDNDQKDEVYSWWFEEEDEKRGKILIATTAFGEGIDCPFVSVVVNFGDVFGKIDYFQQIGRAARGARIQGYCLFISRDEKNLAKVFGSGTCQQQKKCCLSEMAFYYDLVENYKCSEKEYMINCLNCWTAEAKEGEPHWSKKCLADENLQCVFSEEEEEEEDRGGVQPMDLDEDNLYTDEFFQMIDTRAEMYLAKTRVDQEITRREEEEKLLFNTFHANYAALLRDLEDWKCYICPGNCHSFKYCPANKSCSKCGVKHCQARDCQVDYKSYFTNTNTGSPSPNICFSCFLPKKVAHYCLIAFKKILLFEYCQNVPSRDRFFSTYFDSATTWQERLEMFKRIEKVGNLF